MARTKLLEWLLRRVAPKRETDNNKLYAAEVLSILFQSSEVRPKYRGGGRIWGGDNPNDAKDAKAFWVVLL